MSQKLAAIVVLALVMAPAIGISKGPRPVDLTLKDTNGQKVRLRDFRGKVVVLNFWATWCGPCHEELRMFAEVEKEYAPRGVVFVAASLDERETRPKIPDFIARFNIGFPVWVGASVLDLEDLKLGQALPATAFLDRDGSIVARVLGPVTRDELKERLGWLTERSGQAPNPLIDRLSGK